MLTCICDVVLMSRRLPVIIGAAPHSKSGWGKGQCFFANGTSDQKGPPQLQPSSASTSIKQKQVKKSKTTTPFQSPSPVPPPKRTSQQAGKIGSLDPLNDDTSSLLELDDEYWFVEYADDNEGLVAPCCRVCPTPRTSHSQSCPYNWSSTNDCTTAISSGFYSPTSFTVSPCPTHLSGGPTYHMTTSCPTGTNSRGCQCLCWTSLLWMRSMWRTTAISKTIHSEGTPRARC